MIKSTISLVRTSAGWALVQGTETVVVVATKREARTLLREARAAERVARKFLKGAESDETGRSSCDVRCTSAVGPVCECACAGANHSADHLLAA